MDRRIHYFCKETISLVLHYNCAKLNSLGLNCLVMILNCQPDNVQYNCIHIARNRPVLKNYSNSKFMMSNYPNFIKLSCVTLSSDNEFFSVIYYDVRHPIDKTSNELSGVNFDDNEHSIGRNQTGRWQTITFPPKPGHCCMTFHIQHELQYARGR